MDRTYTFRVDNGQVFMPEVDFLGKTLQSLPDGKYVLKIAKVRKGRTLDQNKLWWAMMNEVAVETGNDPEDIHEACKLKFLLRRKGKLIYTKSTTTLSTKEFSELYEKARLWFLEEFNITIIPPDLRGLLEDM